MYRILLTLAVILLLLGTGILGYGLYVALRPSPTCIAQNAGCGAPPSTVSGTSPATPGGN